MITSRLLRRLSHPVSLLGLTVTGVGFAASLIALVTELTGEESTAYQGLLTFVLYPGIAITGLFITSIGVLLERRRSRKLSAASEEWHPSLDIAQRRGRVALWALGCFVLAFAGSSVVGAYHAYEFTESKSFCGSICHVAMEPQFVAHQSSPHAKIDCVRCHVGPGVSGYVSAKFSGMRQLKQVLLDTVPRPIRAGEEKIAIVSEACEECHRPDLLPDSQLDTSVRYGFDLASTERSLRLLFRRTRDPLQGTHWHSGLEISFRAEGARAERIPWVRVRRSDGSETVYERATGHGPGGGPELGEEREMSCIDCHSRPAHRFEPPENAVDIAIARGEIDRSLPSIKKIAVAALSRDHGGLGTDGVEGFVKEQYRTSFDGRVLAREETLGEAIASIRRIYSRSVFPEMQVDWTTHPDHVGHRGSPGCFRCHGGQHTSADGRTLPSECATCHEFFEKARDSADLTAIPADGSSFHPFRNENHPVHECWTCHSESASPYEACTSCHAEAASAHGMRFECSICHVPGSSTVGDVSCGPCHPTGDSPLHRQQGHGSCLGCHQPHGWTVSAGSCATSGCHVGTDPAWAAANREGFHGVGFHLLGLPVTRTPKSE